MWFCERPFIANGRFCLTQETAMKAAIFYPIDWEELGERMSKIVY
jgi:hypothetical protein